MLESPSLLVRPPDAAAVRAVVEPATGAPLGSARRRRGRGFWGRWFGRPVLEVREHEDEPLLFTVRRCWGWPGGREVRDADGRFVGTLRGWCIWDRFGRPLAGRAAPGGPGYEELGSPEGRVLAILHYEISGIRLSFTPEVAADPFAKMLVLAAALEW
jgi:hypothetical protein